MDEKDDKLSVEVEAFLMQQEADWFISGGGGAFGELESLMGPDVKVGR